jgi:hypothetical protein
VHETEKKDFNSSIDRNGNTLYISEQFQIVQQLVALGYLNHRIILRVRKGQGRGQKINNELQDHKHTHTVILATTMQQMLSLRGLLFQLRNIINSISYGPNLSGC